MKSITSSVGKFVVDSEHSSVLFPGRVSINSSVSFSVRYSIRISIASTVHNCVFNCIFNSIDDSIKNINEKYI